MSGEWRDKEWWRTFEFKRVSLIGWLYLVGWLVKPHFRLIYTPVKVTFI